MVSLFINTHLAYPVSTVLDRHRFPCGWFILAPIINGGKDPKFQKLGVDILFWALVAVVVGSFIGNYLAIAHIMPANLNFWLGHQGYEYVDLGRIWQIGKFTGIVLWLVLMLRGIVPALYQPGDKICSPCLPRQSLRLDYFTVQAFSTASAPY